MTRRKRRVRPLSTDTAAQALLTAALIWHAATVISGDDANDSAAAKILRRECVRYLRATRRPRK